MIRNIVHDVIFLGRKSEAATKDDLPVVQDLLDTLKANRMTCVGMAANMIGSLKRIIVVHRIGATKFSSTRSSKRRPILLRPKKAVCPWSARGRQRATGRYRCSTRTAASANTARPLPAGRPRSSSTNVTTWTASSYRKDACRTSAGRRVSHEGFCHRARSLLFFNVKSFANH